MTARGAAWLAGGAMLVVYLATVAPSVTFWDAGEFIAAARVLGIPHPPGTPLFVLLLNASARLWWFLPFAVATNLLSAVCTAGAVVLTAAWIGRGARTAWVAVAAVSAGAMTSVWQNATETEVYAASLALAIATIASADLAGRTGGPRWRLLTAYLLALAVPLHASALVAAPVVIHLASARPDGTRDWSTATALGGVGLAAIGLTRVSLLFVALGAAMVIAGPVVGALTGALRRDTVDRRAAAKIVFAAAVAFSGLLFLLVRARHDPAINQGNPSTWSQLAYVVGREQYDLPGVWPRRAPFWLQVANWFEYADWQFALSLAPSVIPSVGRVLATVAFATLGVVGAKWHRAADRRTWTAVALLFACGSLGVIVYLNLQAGASFGYGFVPARAAHEARERDYFFVLGFWAWGIWVGLGALALVRQLRLSMVVGAACAALPIVLNWKAVNRRAEPEASLPGIVASSLLSGLPLRTVLFVAGDNDSYPLWFAQQVDGTRRDVTVVTIPLLGARWYAAELERRQGFHLAAGRPLAIARSVADEAQRLGRPVAVAMTVPRDDRAELGHHWTVVGHSLLATEAGVVAPSLLTTVDPAIDVDSARTAAAAAAVEAWLGDREVRPAVDPVHEYFLSVLLCPRLVLARSPSRVELGSRDSTCNVRAP